MNVSVVIPTYNRAGLIGETLDSVLNQTVPVDEIIVVDDGSTDNTPEILAGYGSRIKCIRIPNSGHCTVPRNVGFAAARGDYVAQLDDDDIWHPTKIEKQLAAFESHPDAVMAYCDYDYIDQFGAPFDGSGMFLPMKLSNGRLTPADEYWDDAVCQLMLGQFIGASTPLIKRAVLDKVGDYDTRLLFCEDRDLFIRIAYEGRIVRVPERLVSYRVHPSAYSINNAERYVSSQRLLHSKIRLLVKDDRNRREFHASAWRAIKRHWASPLVTVAYRVRDISPWKRMQMLVLALWLDPSLFVREPHVWKNAARCLVGVSCCESTSG